MGMRKIVKSFAHARGFQIRRAWTGSSVTEFLAMLRPYATEHDLIRLGGEADGGYLVPDDLDGIAACFSPGVGKVAEFEQECLDRGMRVFQLDPRLDVSPLADEGVEFERKALGLATDAGSVTLDDWVQGAMPDPADDLLLQIDIEGGEWPVLAQVSDATLARFRVIVVELHMLDLLFDRMASAMFRPVIEKLQRHFDIVHLHVNNARPSVTVRDVELPRYVELTLLRKDRITTRVPVTSLPHPLDRDNVPRKPPASIPPLIFTQH